MSSCRVIRVRYRVRYKDALYHPVVSSAGQMLQPAELQDLSTTPFEHPTIRRIKFCAADESRLRDGQPGLRPQRLQWSKAVPLTFLDTGLQIGTVKDMVCLPPGTTQQTEGHHLIAVARMHDSVLADVAWQALKQHLFGGVCAVIGWQEKDADGWGTGGEVLSIILGDAESSCIPAALVLALYEEARSTASGLIGRPAIEYRECFFRFLGGHVHRRRAGRDRCHIESS